MARSNGPMTPPGPGAGRTQRPDPQSWAQGTTPSQPAPTRAPQSQQPFTPQSAGAAYQQAAYGGPQAQPAADPRYARPQQAEPRTAPPQRQAQQPATSSAFDNFVAQQSPAGYGGGHAAAPAYDQSRQAYPSLNAGGQNAGYAQSGYGESADHGSGFGQWANPAAAADARGFDYGSFDAAPAATQPAAGHYGHAGYGQDLHGHAQDQGYGPGEWGQNGYDQHALTADGYDQSGYHQQQPNYGQPGGEQGYGEQAYGEEDYEEEPRRRRKMPLIAAAVAAALFCGGGLAYGYKTLLGPVPTGDTPLIKTSSIPSKVKPDDPGGRKFGRDAGSKIMGEPLGDAAVGGQTDGARKVQTVEVRPDGSVVPASGSNPGPMAANAMGFPSAGETGAPAGEAAAPEPPPQVIAKAEPPPPAAAASEPAEDVAAPAAAAPPKKVQSKKVAAAAAPQGTIGPTPSGAGWVAVLASVPVSSNSQMDSLKQFADMQQKYNDVLGDKTPSVQEANLGEKGRYHRLVVGPPGSRDSASSVCGSLKTAGYSGCWVAQY